jgi:hypothetical protein
MMGKLISGRYSKFLVAVATAAEAGLQAFWPSAGWVPLAMTGIGAVLVYLVPNVTAAAAAPPAG